MDKIIIIGGGGHAKVIITILKKLKKYEIFGYTDNINRGNILDVPCIGNDDDLKNIIKSKNINHAVIGIGQIKDSSKRYNLCDKLLKIGLSLPPVISPDAIINEDVLIGEGTVVMDGVVVNTGAKIGSFDILNTQSSIDHDCEIGNFVHIGPGATLSGGVIVGENSLIGAGATIVQLKAIGKNCIIGAGAVVVKDCLESGTYLGIPANKIINEKNSNIYYK